MIPVVSISRRVNQVVTLRASGGILYSGKRNRASGTKDPSSSGSKYPVNSPAVPSCINTGRNRSSKKARASGMPLAAAHRDCQSGPSRSEHVFRNTCLAASWSSCSHPSRSWNERILRFVSDKALLPATRKAAVSTVRNARIIRQWQQAASWDRLTPVSAQRSRCPSGA